MWISNVCIFITCIIVLLQFDFIYTTDTPNNGDKAFIQLGISTDNIEGEVLKHCYSVICLLKNLIGLFLKLESLSILLTPNTNALIQELLKSKKGVDEQHTNTKQELLRRGYDLLFCLDTVTTKRISNVGKGIDEYLYTDQKFQTELLLELMDLIRVSIISITNLKAEIKLNDGYTTESIRDILLSLLEGFSDLVLNVSEDITPQPGSTTNARGRLDNDQSEQLRDLYGCENKDPNDNLANTSQQACSSSRNNDSNEDAKDSQGFTAESSSRNKRGNKKKKGKSINDNQGESGAAFGEGAQASTSESARGQEPEQPVAGPSSSSGGVDLNRERQRQSVSKQSEKVDPTENRPKKHKSKKKHLDNNQEKLYVPPLVMRAEDINLDERGGAKQKRKGKREFSEIIQKEGSNPGSRNYSHIDKTQKAGGFSGSGLRPRGRSDSRSPGKSRSGSRSRGSRRSRSGSRSRGSRRSRSGSRSRGSRRTRSGSQTRRTRSGSRGIEPEAAQSNASQGEGFTTDNQQLLFLVQEAEEKLKEILDTEMVLKELSYELYLLFVKMTELYNKMTLKGHLYSGLCCQIEILSQHLTGWFKENDVNDPNWNYSLMNADSLLAKLPSSVASRKGIAAKVCNNKDCCTVNHPDDKQIVGYNECNCPYCDCNCIYCRSSDDSDSETIYNVD
ncbi:hypothetical protein OJ253_1810 [Cryptosporidium canis]|uniref:Uncharacterized protein n=1 Tax=Cryptosporidium canis TaxID=195482 RepID=A0A9D5HXK5_9CRYT|nr:hypothetical protein OJ253_1810 [Cryptosporidium canis]